MPKPKDFNPENYHIYWPAILGVFAVQMAVLIAVSIAVASHSNFTTASSPDVKAKVLAHQQTPGDHNAVIDHITER
jgi:hypothetical protein